GALRSQGGGGPARGGPAPLTIRRDALFGAACSAHMIQCAGHTAANPSRRGRLMERSMRPLFRPTTARLAGLAGLLTLPLLAAGCAYDDGYYPPPAYGYGGGWRWRGGRGGGERGGGVVPGAAAGGGP